MFVVMVYKRYSLAWVLVPLALSACLAQSSVQANYVVQQKICENASRAASDAVAEGADHTTDHAAALVTQFVQCMNKAGWHVPMPKTAAAAAPAAPAAPAAAAVAAQPAPASPPVSAPAAVASSPSPQPAAPAASMQPQPPVMAPAVPASPQAAAAATYQPARPANAPDGYYGGSAGRQF